MFATKLQVKDLIPGDLLMFEDSKDTLVPFIPATVLGVEMLEMDTVELFTDEGGVEFLPATKVFNVIRGSAAI